MATLADIAAIPAVRKAADRIGEYASDRMVARVLRECHRLLSVRAEANSPAIAQQVIALLEQLTERELDGLFGGLVNEFSPDPVRVLEAAQAYASARDANSLAALMATTEPPRQELFRRLNRAPHGTAAIVRLRRHLLGRLKKNPDWHAIEADLLHLLSSWFNPGFLEMRRVDWNSPAHLLEQIIQHEAVHAIDGWDDLRRRLQPDRRCFAFFHPQLANVPLIFVEVALLQEMPSAIAPLLDKRAAIGTASKFRVAAFYSISNCEPGLRGVNLGNFLIKRVANELQQELPQIKTFCTLSPMPGFLAWLHKLASPLVTPRLKSAASHRLQGAYDALLNATRHELASLNSLDMLGQLTQKENDALLSLASYYLTFVTPESSGDAVARFHLDNGARLERINLLANPSANGLKQSAGLMVNYLYDLKRVEESHEAFVNGEVIHSRAVKSLMA
ncbi:MAG: decarboxylase [Burkholderiales bacterium]|nr:MAG: decarboxylase [Burkholderiales bacterium]TAG79991.1 MAG: decarboxylase [Betaproteobacteria bacterium]